MNEISEKKLKIVSIDEIDELIIESKNAFLPSINNPTQTSEEMIREMSVDSEFKIFSCFIDNKPVSYIVGLGGKSPGTLSIGPMYVAINYQGLGIGNRQVVEFIKYAKQKGFKFVFTKTWMENKKSRAIFESLNFNQDGIKPNDRANGDSTIRYLLKI